MAVWIVACGQAVTALPLGPLLPLLVDVRTQAEWDAGHIRCAHLLPVQDDPLLISTVRQLVGGDLTAPIITYCHSGVRAGRAGAASAIMLDGLSVCLGIARVFVAAMVVAIEGFRGGDRGPRRQPFSISIVPY